MAKLETVKIFHRDSTGPIADGDKFDPAKTGKDILGRKIDPWLVVNTGRHTKWGIFDAATGMRIVHTLSGLKDALELLGKFDAAGLELEKSDGWTYVDGPRWGDHKSYTSESIRAISKVTHAHLCADHTEGR